MRSEVICIKLGGSVITDKHSPYTARIDVIKSIARVLKRAKKPLLISHGSGSFGHTSAAKYSRKKGYVSRWGIAKVSYDASEINRIVTQIFIEEGLPAISFSPMSQILAKKGDLSKIFFDPVRASMRQGLIPIVYGDVIWDTEWKSVIYSGEKILNILCLELRKDYKIDTIIELCNVDGVMDSHGNIIPSVTAKSLYDVKRHIYGKNGVDVTGGMLHKINEALTISKNGISTQIVNGNNSEKIKKALQKKHVGTIISL